MSVNSNVIKEGRRNPLYKGRSNGSRIGRYVKNVFLFLFALVSLYPFIWMIASSFKTDGQILANPTALFVADLTLDSYKTIWSRIPFFLFYRNSIIFAGTVTVSCLFFDTLAGYAFARMRFKGRNILFILVLSTMMIPFQAIMIPLFVELHKFGILDTFTGLILPRASGPFGVFMMRSFFITLPKDLEEAARIDGCNEFRIFRSIMLPLCKPAFASLGLFVFNGNWNDLLYPMLMTSKDSMRTLQAGIALLMGRNVVEYSLTMAGAFLSVLPIIIAYIFLQKYFIKGIAMSGMKA
ncbi:MAG: carbohydrate ABC transporter permease [Clostridiaceae bacterium]|nr:carbohydrate ABC transporter permease [Clostridiaceae bacterium]